MRSRRRDSAFTLTELLVVIIIGSIIMAIGVGIYQKMNRDLAWHAEVTAVTSLLHAARNAAITNRTPVSVVFEFEPADYPYDGFMYLNRSYASFWRRVGSWSFEPENWSEADGVLTGAMAQKAAMHGSPELAAGKFGKAIVLRQLNSDAPDYIECERIPAYDIREGMRISAWVKPEPPPADEDDAEYYSYPIVSKGVFSTEGGNESEPVYSLMLEWEGGRHFRLAGEVNTASSGAIWSETPAVIRPSVWTHVSMIYLPGGSSQAGIRLLVDDEELANAEEPPDDPEPQTSDYPQIKVTPEPLMIGSDGTYYFAGAIDELTIDAATTSENNRRPNSSVIFRFAPSAEGSGAFRLDFDRRGRLAANELPLIIIRSTGTNSATLIGVERTGAVRSWQVSGDSIEQQAEGWSEN